MAIGRRPSSGPLAWQRENKLNEQMPHSVKCYAAFWVSIFG